MERVTGWSSPSTLAQASPIFLPCPMTFKIGSLELGLDLEAPWAAMQFLCPWERTSLQHQRVEFLNYRKEQMLQKRSALGGPQKTWVGTLALLSPSKPRNPPSASLT